MSSLFQSDFPKTFLDEAINLLISCFKKDPAEIISSIDHLRKLSLTIRDSIFFDSLEAFLLAYYSEDPSTRKSNARNLRSCAEILASASPNAEADYPGNPEKLKEYAKRIIKLIDDCGTKIKAVYIANLTRAVSSFQIDSSKYFQLSRCVRYLIEEDLAFLRDHIKEGSISLDESKIDDFRALGLIGETKDGFTYTRRAFELKKYALCYEESHQKIPDHFPERLDTTPNVPMTPDEIDAIMDSCD